MIVFANFIYQLLHLLERNIYGLQFHLHQPISLTLSKQNLNNWKKTVLAMLLVSHYRGVWIESNIPRRFYTFNYNIKWNQYLYVWPGIRSRYSLLKKTGSLVIKFSSIHSGSISNQCCCLADCPWKWYCGSDYSKNFLYFFGIFSCFTMLCLVLIFDQRTVHIISIILLSIHLIHIIMIFFFNQRLLRGLGILNRTADTHKLGIKSSSERIFLIIYIFSFDISCGAFGFCLHYFRKSDAK